MVSDPWSFVDERGSNTFTGTVLDVDGSYVLLRIAGLLYVASPRDDLSHSLIPTTEGRARTGAPWGKEDWRGGEPPALVAQLHGL